MLRSRHSFLASSAVRSHAKISNSNKLLSSTCWLFCTDYRREKPLGYMHNGNFSLTLKRPRLKQILLLMLLHEPIYLDVGPYGCYMKTFTLKSIVWRFTCIITNICRPYMHISISHRFFASGCLTLSPDDIFAASPQIRISVWLHSLKIFTIIIPRVL